MLTLIIQSWHRVNKVKDVAFRVILEHYRKLCHGGKPQPEVYRAVPLNDSGKSSFPSGGKPLR